MNSLANIRGCLDCSCKAVTKFCLLYYITLNLVVLLFTAVNQENLTREQVGWYWGFLISLFITASLSITSLMVLLYTDYYSIMPAEPEATQELNKGIAAQNDENSSSFKTVLTINSTLPDKSHTKDEQKSQLPTLQGPEPPDLSGFVNLTPSTKSPVTLVDMKKGKLDKKVVKTVNKLAAKMDALQTVDNNAYYDDAAANLATIPSDVLTKESKEKTNPRLKAKKKVKVKKKPSSK